ncbi:MAG: alpha/beta hydrolase [Anaerolineae bacterium]|nr:alpha/beta hydrolase [Anaerolineae bacterium]
MTKCFYLLCLLSCLALSSLRPPACSAQAPTSATPPYEVIVTQKMYLPEEPFHITDLRYSKCDFETRTLQICQPHRDGYPLVNRPVIFFIHGGAWVDGYASWYTDILTPVLTAEEGWIVVNVDYRLTSEQVLWLNEPGKPPPSDPCQPENRAKAAWYDDNIQDVAAAFQWVLQHIAAYGGDTRNIFLFGHSAGGHLVP